MTLTCVPGEIVLTEDQLEAGLDRLFGRFDAAMEACRFARRYRLAETSVDVHSSLSDYLVLCDAALTQAGTTANPSGRLLVSVEGTEGCPRLRWCSPFFRERDIEGRLRSTRYRLHLQPDEGFWQVYDRDTGRGWQIMKSASGFPAWDPGSPLRNLLHWQLNEAGCALIHAGTLAHAGRGALLAGAGGSGKSGTVITGLLHGLQTVGDDYVGVDPGRMRAFPIFNTLKQDDPGLRRMGLLGHRAIPPSRNWQGKYQFSVHHIGPGLLADSMAVDMVLLPRVTGEPSTRFESVSPMDAFLALAPSGVSQIPGDRTVQARVAAAVLRRVPSYRMWLGTDPAEVVASMRQFLEGF